VTNVACAYPFACKLQREDSPDARSITQSAGYRPCDVDVVAAGPLACDGRCGRSVSSSATGLVRLARWRERIWRPIPGRLCKLSRRHSTAGCGGGIDVVHTCSASVRHAQEHLHPKLPDLPGI
jgi:hypothetical protein